MPPPDARASSSSLPTSPTAAPSRAATSGGGRLDSLDIVRGAVMVLMAVDHVRVYSGLPAGGPTVGIFFTRWITHFCAPVFVFLAGTGAFLHGRKLGDPRKLAGFLVTRGLWLILLELTVIRLSWTFSVDYSQFLLAGVIWMFGWCMILLAGLVWLPARIVGTIGLLVIVFQSGFGFLGHLLPESWRWVWEFVYPVGVEVRLGPNGPFVAVLYSIVPWIGVMAAGYGFGEIMTREPTVRRRLCLQIGLAAIALFVVWAGLLVALRPAPPNAPPAILRVLNQQKYPASALFLLMTLGPAIALLPLAERARGWIATALVTFGRVPMFYYLLHIPAIHTVSLLVWFLRDGAVHHEWFASAPYTSVPPPQRWGLPLLYLVFAIVIAILYPPCRWFARVKARGSQRWLSYF